MPEDAAQRLDQPYAQITAAHAVGASAGGVGWRIADSPGLPLEALGDPAFREAFTLMRFEREHRLMALACGAR